MSVGRGAHSLFSSVIDFVIEASFSQFRFQDEKDEEILWNFEQQTGSENAVRGGFSCVKDTGIDPLYSEELLVIDMLRVLQERGPEAITSSAVDTERFLGSVKEFSSRGVLDRMSEGGEGDVEFFWDTVFEVAGRLPKASMSPAAAARHFLCNALRRLETMHVRGERGSNADSRRRERCDASPADDAPGQPSGPLKDRLHPRASVYLPPKLNSCLGRFGHPNLESFQMWISGCFVGTWRLVFGS